MRRLFSSFAVKVQVSDEHVTTGLIIVLYIFILVFFVRNFDFINFARASDYSYKKQPTVIVARNETYSRIRHIRCLIIDP